MTPELEWAVAGRPLEGQVCSGDAHVVRAFDGGVLVAVTDGLGHGEQAAEASELAVRVLSEDPTAEVGEQLRRCHERLRGTRGVVMSVARFNLSRSEMSWSGVGNVEAVLVRADPKARRRRESLLLFGGVVGGTLAGIRTASVAVERGDVLMMATDGVRPEFSDRLDVLAEAKMLAERTLHEFGRATDDALVLAARWFGDGVTARLRGQAS